MVLHDTLVLNSLSTHNLPEPVSLIGRVFLVFIDLYISICRIAFAVQERKKSNFFLLNLDGVKKADIASVKCNHVFPTVILPYWKAL